MLVLSRKQNESIVVTTPDGDLVFTIIEMRGNKVRVGITAPEEWPVHRQEVHDAIAREGLVRRSVARPAPKRP